jgi:predicted NBD/HSP70 family sugar kinase
MIPGVGIDLGGTKIEAILLVPDGDVLLRRQRFLDDFGRCLGGLISILMRL